MIKKTFVVAVFLATILLLTTAPLKVVDAQTADEEEEFECTGICGNNEEEEEQKLNNPDTVVTYSWNDNVPVGSSTVGETEQTMTCQQFDLRLYSFSNDESECLKHQTGLQTAGCVCGDGSSGSSSNNIIGLQQCFMFSVAVMVTTMAAAATAVFV